MRAILAASVIVLGVAAYCFISWSDDGREPTAPDPISVPTQSRNEAKAQPRPDPVTPIVFDQVEERGKGTPNLQQSRPSDSEAGKVEADLAVVLTERAKAVSPDWTGHFDGLDLMSVAVHIIDAEMGNYGMNLLFQTTCHALAGKALRAGSGFSYGTPTSDYPTLETARAALSPTLEDYIHVFSSAVPPRVVILRLSENEGYLKAWEQRELARGRIGREFVEHIDRLRKERHD